MAIPISVSLNLIRCYLDLTFYPNDANLSTLFVGEFMETKNCWETQELCEGTIGFRISLASTMLDLYFTSICYAFFEGCCCSVLGFKFVNDRFFVKFVIGTFGFGRNVGFLSVLSYSTSFLVLDFFFSPMLSYSFYSCFINLTYSLFSIP